MASATTEELQQGPLARAFLARLPRKLAHSLAKEPRLEQWLSSLVTRAREPWPNLEIDPVCFVEHVADRLPSLGPVDERLSSLNAGDLLLAFACLRGTQAAVAEVARRLQPGHLKSVRPSSALAASIDDVLQAVSIRVLLPRDAAPPEIIEYSGRGTLDGWLRAVVLHAAIKEQQCAGKVESPGSSLARQLAQADPELAYLKTLYAQDLHHAFFEAVHTLTCRERSLLRLFLVSRVGVTKIARCYHVHRATMSRMLAETRTKLREETKKALGRRLDLDSGEASSLMRLVDSQLDVSIVGALKGSSPGPDATG
ncbi:MAG: hypothetical protein HY901_02060 [Deltaproteobacteria bacterium]|nr:hypothetical protein [Deltaproteobacteria bacterium]